MRGDRAYGAFSVGVEVRDSFVELIPLLCWFWGLNFELLGLCGKCLAY